MTRFASHLRRALAIAPLALLASCASDKSAGRAAAERAPGVGAPLTTLEAAEIVQRNANGSDSRVSIVDDLDDGHLFAVTSGFDAGSRPPRQSRLVFVGNDGTVRNWLVK